MKKFRVHVDESIVRTTTYLVEAESADEAVEMVGQYTDMGEDPPFYAIVYAESDEWLVDDISAIEEEDEDESDED